MKNIFNHIRIALIAAFGLLMVFSCQRREVTPPIFDIYNTGGSDTTGYDSDDSTVIKTGIDTSKYAEARQFPGLVGKDVPRVENKEVTLDLNYKDIAQDLKVNTPEQPQFSTGLYAPAGEKITINVPAGTTGLTVQIGAWTDDLYNMSQSARIPLIFVQKKLTSGENIIWNLYGGTIYIKADKPIAQPVTLTFTGPVEAPDFILGETNPGDWWSKVQSTDVPWLELRSDNMILTVPRYRLLKANLSDPTNLMTFWNDAVQKDFKEGMGLSDNPGESVDQASLLPYRIVMDTLVLGEKDAHSGYPVFVVDNDKWFANITDMSKLSQAGVWDIYKLLGQNNTQPNMWTWEGLKETASDFFGVQAAHRLGKNLNDLNPDIASIVPDALDFSESTGSKDFNAAGHSELFKLIPFIQIFEKATPAAGNGTSGYDFIPFLYKAARRADSVSSSDQEKQDFLYKTLSDFLQEDTRLFFSAWGITVSGNAKQDIQSKGYDLLTQTLWTYDPIQDTGGTGQVNPYINSSWTVVSTSSHSDPGSNAIDGNNSTFWQSDWHTGAPPPHIITIDMGVPLKVGSFYFVQRSDNLGVVQIKSVQVEVSNDGQNWDYLTTFFLQEHPANPVQTFRLDAEHTFQYFRLTVPNKEALYGNNDLALSEVGVNKDFGGIPDYTPVNGDYYDRKNWTIYGFSSDQPTSEGTYHGVISNILDGNADSYWHTSWSAYSAAPPHFVVVDMHHENDVYGFTFTQRKNGSRNIKNLNVQVSNDLKNWEDISTYLLQKTNDPQAFWFSQKKTFRYFKLETQSNSDVWDGTNFLSLAEVNVEKDPNPNALPPGPYNPANWSIIGVSSVNSDYPVSNILDRNYDTFWKTDKIADDEAPSFVVDMGQALSVKEFHLVQKRPGAEYDNKISKFKIETSSDGINWDLYGDFNLDWGSSDPQTRSNNSEETFRYFRITITQTVIRGYGYGAGSYNQYDYGALGEIWVTD